MEELRLGPYVDDLVEGGWTPASFFREIVRKNHTFTLSFMDLDNKNVLLLQLEAALKDVVDAETLAKDTYKLFEKKTVLTVIQGPNDEWIAAKDRRKGRKKVQFDWKYISRHGLPSSSQAEKLLRKGYTSPPFVTGPLPGKGEKQKKKF